MVRAGLILGLVATGLATATAAAQDNYEIQVYGSETVAPATTMVELHSNFTADGRRTVQDGLWPTEDAEHETIEITHGWTSWFETGWYVFTYMRDGNGWQWAGDHIRPRVRAPVSWGWPVGVSISTEIGYQRSEVSADTWTWGDPADSRPNARPMVPLGESGAGTIVEGAERHEGHGVLAGGHRDL